MYLFLVFFGTVIFLLKIILKITDSIATGKALFNQNCASCHAILEETMGPPLGGITKFLSKEELFQFIKNPSEVIATGNKRANFLLSRYKTIMPSYGHLNDEQLANIVSFIDDETLKNNLEPFKTNFSNAIVSKAYYKELSS